MITYHVNYGDHKGSEYPEYTKFPRQHAPCGITWVALDMGGNRVHRFDLSQLSEVKSPFDSGMLYTCEPPPKPEPIDVWITADMVGSQRLGIPGIDIGKSRLVLFKDIDRPDVFGEPPPAATVGVRIVVAQPVSLYHESMAA